ncbi:hypothetical protein, partial [Streptomyces sp. NPDC093094]|uniref:hypothetical protein n=1 Tax=Streptomyces sp. NPDC093094 TaxID=3366026 RepID=UPI003819AD2A
MAVVGEENQRPAPPSLRTVGIGRRVDALFRAMSADLLLREQFVTDPAQILSEYVGGSRLSPQQASVVNQLIHSVASDTEVLAWLRDYVVEHRDTPVSRDRFMVDLGRAVAERKSVPAVLALLRFALEGEDLAAAVDEALVPIVNDCGLFGDERASGTEISTGTAFGTEQSGTHISTGPLVSGTETSTGTAFGTEQSGTHISTGPVVSGTETSTGTAFGTEQSGTHISTGPVVSGTETSTGTAFGTEQSGTHISTGPVVSGTEIST